MTVATAAIFQHTKEIEELERNISESKRKMEFEKTKRFENRVTELKSQVENVLLQFFIKYIMMNLTSSSL